MGAAELAVPAAVMDGKDPERFSNAASPSIDRYCSVIARREEVDGFYIPESTCGNIVPYTELSRSSSQLSSSLCRDSPEELKLASGIFSPLSISSLEGKQIRRRSGKMASSSNGCSKRSRMGQIEDISMNEDANDVKEKSQMPKTKNGLNGKRLDRRNGKVSMKSKYDFFSLKAGMVTFNSGGGGSNSVGICGLKPDAYDITKHLDEITVKELLDGHYKDPSLAKDKGKRAANLNENIVNSVRMAFSILQRKKPVKVQCSADIDDTYNWNVSAAPVCVSTSNVDEKGDAYITDMTSHGKVPSKVLDFQLYQPKDILERVGLPLSVDLDALLVDAAKPVIFPKDSLDYRGKQISQRASLANADAIKFSTSRSSCHGKWARIDNTTDLFGGRTDFLAELDSLNYDPKLIPVKSMKYILSANRAALCEPGSSTSIDFCSSSTATCSRVSQLSIEYGGKLKCEENGEGSPRSLAAAQILCNIVKQFPKQEQHQRMTWTSKPSDKTIKACRSKPDNKFVEISAKPESAESSHGLVKSKETSPIFKKSRLLINEKGKDLNTGTKGMVNWTLPRSSTHSPSKPFRDNHTNLKSYNSFMMPPPSSKVFDKASNSRQKLR